MWLIDWDSYVGVVTRLWLHVIGSASMRIISLYMALHFVFCLQVDAGFRTLICVVRANACIWVVLSLGLVCHGWYLCVECDIQLWGVSLAWDLRALVHTHGQIIIMNVWGRVPWRLGGLQPQQPLPRSAPETGIDRSKRLVKVSVIIYICLSLGYEEFKSLTKCACNSCLSGVCYTNGYSFTTVVEGRRKLAQGCCKCGFYLCYVLSSGGKGEGPYAEVAEGLESW